MTQVVATGTVFLPFALQVCAVGPTLAPLAASVEEADVTLRVPDSMTDGAVGKSLYPNGYALWAVDRLYVESAADLDRIDADIADTERIRGVLLGSAQTAVRRFLNSYRWRLNQPRVHPVALDPAQFTLEMVHEDGSRDPLPEPFDAFFFHHTPQEAPLESSLNLETLQRLQQDVADGIEPPHADLYRLDIAWLEGNGETARAAELRALMLNHETVYSEGD